MVPFTDEADAVAIANYTPYGLSGSIWTHNLGRALRVARAVEAGNLSVNSHSSVRQPAGCSAASSSRDWGGNWARMPWNSFTETKNVFIATEE